MPQKELGSYSVGNGKLDKWHGQSGQIGIKNITEGICGKWIAERMTFKP